MHWKQINSLQERNQQAEEFWQFSQAEVAGSRRPTAAGRGRR